MTVLTSVFLSFSSRDLSYVNELLASMKHQGIDVWDYSNDIESIEAGGVITDRLKREIDQRGVFIPIVSSNSLSKELGKYTKLETEYAIKRRKRIIPIKLSGAPETADWNYPYSELISSLYLEIDIFNDRAYTRQLIKLCRELQVEFQPLDRSHPRLPFWAEFRAEVAEIPKTNYHHSLLMEFLWAFNKHYFRQKYKEASFQIDLFITTCSYILPEYKPFYPLIVQGVCHRHMEKLDEAEECYLKANENHPGHDEANIFGGLGGVYLQKESYEKALQYYTESLKHSSLDNNTDEKFNFAAASIFANKDLDRNLEDFVLNLSPITYSFRTIALYHAQSQIYYRRKEYRNAMLCLGKTIIAGDYNQSSMIFLSRCLQEEFGEFNSQMFLALTIDTLFPSSKILKRELLEITKSIKDYQKSLEYFEKYILNDDCSNEELIEYAMLYFCVSDNSKAFDIAASIVESSRTSYPNSVREMYYLGFAYYILSENETASVLYHIANTGLPSYRTHF
jgi:tetratricopeptide (TPR) repeat protein